jgi:hypothetical protein
MEAAAAVGSVGAVGSVAPRDAVLTGFVSNLYELRQHRLALENAKEHDAEERERQLAAIDEVMCSMRSSAQLYSVVLAATPAALRVWDQRASSAAAGRRQQQQQVVVAQAAQAAQAGQAAQAAREAPRDESTGARMQRLFARAYSIETNDGRFGTLPRTTRAGPLDRHIILHEDAAHIAADKARRLAHAASRRPDACRRFNDNSVRIRLNTSKGHTVELWGGGKYETRIANVHLTTVCPNTPEVSMESVPAAASGAAAAGSARATRMAMPPIDRLRAQKLQRCQVCEQVASVDDDDAVMACKTCCQGGNDEPHRVYHYGCLRKEFRALPEAATIWACPHHTCCRRTCKGRAGAGTPLFVCSVCTGPWHLDCIARVDERAMPHVRDYKAAYLSTKKHDDGSRNAERHLSKVVTMYWRCPSCVGNGITSNPNVTLTPWRALQLKPQALPVRMFGALALANPRLRCAQYDDDGDGCGGARARDCNPYVVHEMAHDVIVDDAAGGGGAPAPAAPPAAPPAPETVAAAPAAAAAMTHDEAALAARMQCFATPAAATPAPTTLPAGEHDSATDSGTGSGSGNDSATASGGESLLVAMLRARKRHDAAAAAAAADEQPVKRRRRDTDSVPAPAPDAVTYIDVGDMF